VLFARTLLLSLGLMACSQGNPAVMDAGPTADGGTDAPCVPPNDDDNCGACGVACTSANHCVGGTCRASSIQHVVLIVEENHTFESYFGNYCTAPAYSNPTCTTGPACCEAAPATEPGPTHASAYVLDDDTSNPASNFAADHDHAQACELQEINDGKMDGYVSGSTGSAGCDGPSCANPYNFAVADSATVGAYWSLASGNALADRYFQPIAGGSSSNDMYFAVAHFQFVDNTQLPNAIGSPSGCLQGLCENGSPVTYQGRTTIADLLLGAGATFAVYADGFADAKAAAPSCEGVPSDCPYSEITHPVAALACCYDASDVPFEYYATFSDSSYIKDYSSLATDLASGTLPSFAYVKAREFHNEHPNVSTIADGIAFVTSAIGMIEASTYASNTLILLTWDEGGGFFDHVSPPQSWPTSVDQDDSGNAVPYGTRVPMLAIGPFARKGTVSHVQMEHASVVRFLEYNFVGPTGQLHARDAQVNNIGSLLDPTATGVTIPH
jgi:phospholipase C